MADTSSGAPAGTLSDAQKLQLVLGNFVQKACESVLHARMMPLPPTLRKGTANRWFNVESEELETVCRSRTPEPSPTVRLRPWLA